MYLSYPKRDAWFCIYEFVASGWIECGSEGGPPPLPPSRTVWRNLSENDKEDAWTLLFEWLRQNDLVDVLDYLSESDWCMSERHYIEDGSSDRAPYGKDPLLTKHQSEFL